LGEFVAVGQGVNEGGPSSLASPRLLKIQIQTLGGAAFEASQLRGFLWGCRQGGSIDVDTVDVY